MKVIDRASKVEVALMGLEIAMIELAFVAKLYGAYLDQDADLIAKYTNILEGC